MRTSRVAQGTCRRSSRHVAENLDDVSGGARNSGIWKAPSFSTNSCEEQDGERPAPAVQPLLLATIASNKGAYLVVGVGWLLGHITMLDKRVQHTIPRHLELVRVTFQRVHTQQDRCCSSGQSWDPHNTAGEVNTPGNRDMRTPVRGHSPAGLYFSSRNSAWRLYIGDRKSVSSSQI